MIIIRVPASDAHDLQELFHARELKATRRDTDSLRFGEEISAVTEFLIRHVNYEKLALLYLCLRELRVKYSIQAGEIVCTFEGIPFPSFTRFASKIAHQLGLPAEPPDDLLKALAEEKEGESHLKLKGKAPASKSGKGTRGAKNTSKAKR
jgi:hypothetical protein